MKKNLIALLIVFTVSNFTLSAQETFKTMFYNVLNYPLQDASKLQYLEIIVDEYRPDLFMVCELNSLTGANAILSSLQDINSNYMSATFVTNSSDDMGSNQNDLQNLIYFDSSKFILESQSVVTTSVRDFNHYKLKLNTVTQNSNPIILDVFVCHLKASSGASNQQSRFNMVTLLEAYIDDPTNGLDETSSIILAGDFNFYTNSEPGFIELTNNTGGITFIDPANRIGSWHNNTNYIDVFTQSTRTQTGLGGATGGFDDRFDFIMTNENMQTNENLKFVSGTYQVFGNNNNSDCYNSEINSADCAGPDFDENIRNALYQMSDHLPVTLEIQTSEDLLSTSEFFISKPIEFTNGNIVSERLELKIDRSQFILDELTIYNVLGQVVLTVSVKNKSNITINTSELSNGMFYVTTSNNKIAPLKFVKTN